LIKRTAIAKLKALAYARKGSYFQSHPGKTAYAIIPSNNQTAPAIDNLPVPPEELWLGYGPTAEAYLSSGKRHISKMNQLLEQDGFIVGEAERILDFGCGAGRMIRHLLDVAPKARLWGVDVSADHIRWCIDNVTPLINFATTTVVPHLPFPDEFFDLIYSGSVFTHIEDIQETWLLELGRILRPGGRLYVTIHDEDTVTKLDGEYKHGKLARMMNEQPVYVKNKQNFNMIVVWRGSGSQVFYKSDYFRGIVPPIFGWRSRTAGAYDYQSAVVLERN
jgi:ubiquinone/menaquinone biosynthesis C-methylase UbiE